MKIIVVGGVAAGASAAVKARRVNEEAEIIIFEKGPYVSFANCGLPYYVGGDIKGEGNLLLVTPQLFKDRFNIDVRVNHEVLKILPEEKAVEVQNEEGVFREGYDKLILAPGSKPVVPKLPGIELPGVYNLFTVDEAVKVRQNLDGVKSAVVVGGGFIGLETAEAFHKQGIKTAIVELAPQLAAGFDPEFSIPLERHLQEKGIDVKLGAALTAIHGSARVEEVELSNGDRIAADLVVVAIGSNPQLALAKNSGLRIGESGGLAVDATMQTSQPDIYAAGDIVESLHRSLNRWCASPWPAAPINRGGLQVPMPPGVNCCLRECRGQVSSRPATLPWPAPASRKGRLRNWAGNSLSVTAPPFITRAITPAPGG